MDNDVSLDPSDQGALVAADGTEVLRFRRILPGAPHEVWPALVERDRLGVWAFPGEFEPRAGGAVSFDYGEHGQGAGTVLAWDEPLFLEYEWGEGPMLWRVRFALSEAPGEGGAGGAGPRTALTFDHLAPDPHDPDFAAGWHWHLDRLARHLAGEDVPQTGTDAHFEELQRLYAHAEG
ncbi:SRPBCC domain-containing protein [Demequina pelophila]|uniref:SRPBCC domain-containing protein n=1 Tax=Demequina pelophila TaxID=1638984 RepID=UPI000785D2C5|nr:SRPBCC domain-containing protein [Demequina pelophila]